MPDKLSDILAEITALAQSLPTDPADYAELSAHKRRAIRASLESVMLRLNLVMISLDVARQPKHVFDPSDPRVIGDLVAHTLVNQDRESLKAVVTHPFYGAGVYAIYYRGSFDCYAPISGKDHPIYFGKADPGILQAATPREQGSRLFSRLKEHSQTILSANNLVLADFDCRYLVVGSAFVGTAEKILIDWFKPVWNKEMKVCQGFGKHGDSPTTRANKRSAWDTLHAGRSWAASQGNVPGKKSAKQICADIAEHFKKYPPKS